MNVELTQLSVNEKPALNNMLEMYLHDISEFNETDDLVLNSSGLYSYEYLNNYWSEKDRYVYGAETDGKYCGFVMIRMTRRNPAEFTLCEFFVLRKYRKRGVGSVMMEEIFKLHKGKWQIDTPIRNHAAKNFWRKIAKQYNCNGVKEQKTHNGKRMEWRFEVK